MRRFVVMQLNEEIEVSVIGIKKEIPLLYMEGMVGVLPIFESRKKAEKVAGDKYKIMEIEVKDNKEKGKKYLKRIIHCG